MVPHGRRSALAYIGTSLLLGALPFVASPAVKHDLLRWMVGMAFAQVGLTVALVRLLPH
jgi:hypothetical protein